jgi:hypothetical protein
MATDRERTRSITPHRRGAACGAVRSASLLLCMLAMAGTDAPRAEAQTQPQAGAGSAKAARSTGARAGKRTRHGRRKAGKERSAATKKKTAGKGKRGARSKLGRRAKGARGHGKGQHPIAAVDAVSRASRRAPGRPALAIEIGRSPLLEAPLAPAAAPPSGGIVTSQFIALQKDGTRLYRRQTGASRRRGSIHVDGVLDEAEWKRMPATRMDWKQRPDEGGSIIGGTDFRVLYDDDALYIGAHMIDPAPDQIRGILHRGVGFDKIPQSDWIGVWVDPTNSRRTGYVFLVNPVGVKLDQRLVDDTSFEDEYDAVWEAKASRDRTGWYAEYRIPYSQLRLNNGYQRSWGFQMARRFARNQEFHTWSPSPVTAGRLVSAFGDLAIDDKIDVGRAFEFLPYVLGGVRVEDVPGANRLDDTVGPEYGAGADFKLNVTDRLALTGAINPDFGQVEADPSEVNLTDRETFFSERRPLFTKDNELYQFGIGRGDENLFYSRRIGASPHLSQSGGDALYVDEDDVTTIYGAAKLSGQLPGDFTLGLLSALASEEQSRAQLADGTIRESTVEPLTSYNVAQLGRSFRDGSSDFRLALTGVNRFLDGTGIDTLHRQAYTGGAHYLHKFADNEWALFGRVAGSYVEGDPAALQLTQQASQRYFQRPDADHVEFDPERTSLAGLSFNTQLQRASGTWKGTAGVDGRSPGFETNDVGFLLDADVLNPWVTVDYDKWVAGDSIKEVIASGTVESVTDWAPDVLRHHFALDGTVTQANDAAFGGLAGYTRQVLDTKLLRGGPAVAGVDSVDGELFYQTPTKRPLHLRVQGDATLRPASSSWLATGSVTFTWHILDNLELSITPAYQRNRNGDQYVATVPPPDGSMDDPRYVLGRLVQTTVRATTRLDYTVTPRMSVQLYAEPFISAGRYDRFKEPASLRATDHGDRYAEFDQASVSEEMGSIQVDADQDGTPDLTFPSPDFKVTTLISNLVYRWEYTPGSTLYVIWSQAGNGSYADRGIHFSDVGDVFSSHAANVLLVKLSYWWSP